jgi:outer membrane usher protein FimD/PapC
MTFELKDNNGQLLPVGSQVYVDNAQDNLYPLDNNHRVTIFGLAVGVHKLHVKTGVDRFCSANYKVSTLKVAALQSKPVDIVCN